MLCLLNGEYLSWVCTSGRCIASISLMDSIKVIHTFIHRLIGREATVQEAAPGTPGGHFTATTRSTPRGKAATENADYAKYAEGIVIGNQRSVISSW